MISDGYKGADITGGGWGGSFFLKTDNPTPLSGQAASQQLADRFNWFLTTDNLIIALDKTPAEIVRNVFIAKGEATTATAIADAAAASFNRKFGQ